MKLFELKKKKTAHKGGRPKVPVKRTAEIKFRATKFEKRTIEKMASLTGMSTAEYCRSMSLNQKPKFKLTEDEIEVYKMLAEYKTNFARISNYMKENKYVSEEIRKVSRLITEQLTKFER